MYVHGGGPTSGGLDKYFINILGPLVKDHGIEPIIVCSSSWSCQKALQERGVRIFPAALPSWTKGKHLLRSVIFILKLLRLIKQTHVQILQVNGFYHAPYVFFAAKLSGKPCIIAPIGQLGPRYVTIYLLRKFDVVVTLSEVAKKSLIEAGVKEEQLVMNYHGIDCSSFMPKVRAQFDPETSICVVANVNYDKGQDVLIHALGKLKKHDKRFTCVFVGSYEYQMGTKNHEYYEHLLQLIDGYDLHKSIRFAGFVEDVRPYLATGDIFILASRTEGLPIALLEAMAMGLPVIATRVGGIPEVVVDGETGILVPPDDPDQLAESIIQLIENRGLQRQYGESGFRRANSHFDVQLEAERYHQTYQTLINET
jgi:glycosyltransferase involved in cell wall biosynthesis